MDYLDFKIEDSLAEMFKIELEITEKAFFYIEEITSIKDFNLYEAFSCIDSYKTGIIEQKGVVLFLSKHGIFPKKEKIELLLKRLDKDNDNKVSFDDFKCLFMIPFKGYSNKQSDPYFNVSVNNYFTENVKKSESYSKDSRIDLSPKKSINKQNSVFLKDYNTNNNNLENDEIRYTTMSHFTQGNEETLSPTSTNSNFKLSGMTDYSSFRLSRRDPNISVPTIRPEHNEKPFKIYMQNCHYYLNKNGLDKKNEFGSTISSNNKDNRNTVKSMVSLDQLNTNIINSSRKNLFLKAKSDSYTYLSTKRLENNTFTKFNNIKNESSEDAKQPMVNEATEKINLNPSNTLPLNNNISQIKTNVSTSQGETISTNAENEYIHYFAMFIKDILMMYNKLEKIREVVNIDTNIYLDDLFKFFDRNNDMIINIKEFKESLDSIDVKANYEELKLIFKRYDLEQNLSINYDEFCRMFYSKNPEYKNMICQKKSSDDDDEKNFEYIRKSFVLKKFFKILIDSENNFEDKRKKLVSHPQFSLYEVWDNIKPPGSDRVTKEDMTTFLSKHKIEASEYEIEILWDVFDKDCGGYISFTEFVDEIYPKNNLNLKE